MSLESTTTIAGLVAANPTAGDPFSQGDDHLRLLKTVLKTTFPGVAAGGFAIPITTTEAELNYVHGVTSAIQTQLDSAVARIPVGIIVMWSGTSAPTGWRLCNGVGGAPDLRDRFVMGLGVDYPTIAATGGSADSVIVTHSHIATSTPNITGLSTTSVAHTHTVGGNSVDHTHPYDSHIGTYSGSAGLASGTNLSYSQGNTSGASTTHVHDVTGGAHVHDVTGSMTVVTSIANANGGVSGVNKNLPPFYVLAFIQKT